MSTQKFQSWFRSRLVVGGYPGSEFGKDFHAKDFTYVINVSDEWYPKEIEAYQRLQYFWFPLNEWKKDIGLNSIFAAIALLSHAESEGAYVYLHCHSGNNRSWTVAAAYYFYRTGQHWERPTRTGHYNKLLANCDRGLLPPIAEMEKWLLYLREELKTGMKPGILGLSKLRTLPNF